MLTDPRSFLVVLLVALSALLPGSVVDAEDSGWVQRPDPIFEGEFVASDPAIIRTEFGYRMFYTCFAVPESGFDPALVRAAICAADSADGLQWEEIESADRTKGLVLAGREDDWDQNLEAAFVVEWQGRMLLYYSGYLHEGDPAQGFPAALAVAESIDGGPFRRLNDGEPVLSPTPGWYDNNAVYSPTIVEHDGTLLMIYAGHCYTQCDRNWGVALLGATSPDGLNWTKLDEPVLMRDVPGANWTLEGVAEPGLVQGSDDLWYLFFTGVEADKRVIGVAVGETPTGPWQVSPDPILVHGETGAFDESGVLAPFVLIEGVRVRMWFLGMTPAEDIAIGYAEAAWPLID